MWHIYSYTRTVRGRTYGPFTSLVRKRPHSPNNDYIYLGKINPEQIDMLLINELWADEDELPTKEAILRML